MIKEYLKRHEEEMKKFLAELIAVRSVQGVAEENCPFGKMPAKVLGIMLEKCREYGFSVNNAENYVGTADYGENPALAILTHLDVVPEGTGWTKTEPYTLKEENGILYGRGAIDDKGPAVASLFALRAIKDLGIPLKRGVRLIFGTNEENGSADLEYYRKHYELPEMVFTPDGEYPVINGEKGMLRVYFSAPFDRKTTDGKYFQYFLSENAINAVPNRFVYSISENQCDSKSEECFVSGKSAHASTPEKGENAITLFIQKYSDILIFRKLSELFPHGELNGISCGLGFSDELSGNMTCVLSKLELFLHGTKITGGIDIRFPLDRKLDDIKNIICHSLEEKGFTVDSCEGTEPHFTDGNSQFVQSLLKVYEKVTGDKGKCISIGGGTYVHDIQGGVAFGAEFPNQDGRMHSPDEFITVENLLRNAEIIAEAITELCR